MQWLLAFIFVVLAQRAWATIKSVSKPGETKQGRQGLSFANVLQECFVCGVILIDGQTQTATLTHQARQMLGLPGDFRSSVPLAKLPEALQRIALETMASGHLLPERSIELAVGGRPGTILRVSALPVEPAQPQAAVVLTVHDLAAATQLEQHIQQLDRLATLGTLAASMAHEIKNALVAGKTFVELLLEKDPKSELGEIVRRETGRIDAIVSRMLKFAGPIKSALDPVRLHEVLEHSLRLVQPQMEGRQISLQRAFEASPDLVLGDEYALQQAFVNLFLNALEAMGPNGTLTVSTQTAGSKPACGQSSQAAQLCISIQDTGIGIGPESLQRLFQPFFTTKSNGTGLGLVITQRIIQKHRGTITARSQAGQGTTFRIELPALEPVR